MILDKLKQWEESNKEFNRLWKELKTIEQKLEETPEAESKTDLKISVNLLQANTNKAWGIICNARAGIKILKPKSQSFKKKERLTKTVP